MASLSPEGTEGCDPESQKCGCGFLFTVWTQHGELSARVRAVRVFGEGWWGAGAADGGMPLELAHDSLFAAVLFEAIGPSFPNTSFLLWS